MSGQRNRTHSRSFASLVAILVTAGALVVPLGALGAPAPPTSEHPAAPRAGVAPASEGGRAPIPFLPVRVHPIGLAAPATVDPNGYYSSEPAPMGIADFGVGANGQPYEYNSTEFLGNFSYRSLDLEADSNYQYSDQLNVVLEFVQNGHNYAYWIQDVAIVDSSTMEIGFEDNIWNFTTSCLNNTGVSGNGTVYPYSGCEGYYAVSATTQPGAYRTLPSPGDYGLLVRSYRGAHAEPEVAFEYWDMVTNHYVTYDNVVWPWAKTVSADNNFLVDGNLYNPIGLFYDAEFSLGGPGNGAATQAENATHATSRLLYWNGHNFEAPPAVWNFGANTAEAVSNIQSIFTSDAAGLPLTLQLNGTARNATPEQAYTQNRVGTLAISAPGIAAGTVAIPGDTWAFVNDSATLTLVPGTYHVWVNSSSASHDLGECEIKAKATLNVTDTGSCGPEVSTPTASPSGVDVAQSVTFHSTLVASGTGGDTYAWKTAPSGLGCTASSSLSLSCTPSDSGSYSVNVTVTDSGGQSATSASLSFSVDSDPSVATPSPSRASAETGQPVTFTAAPKGGATPYNYSWSGLPGPCTGAGTASPTCTPATAGSYSISVAVTDANDFRVVSASLSFTVLSGPYAPVPSASPADSIDVGQAVTFWSNASGGSGDYTYAWSGLPIGCLSVSAPEVRCVPSDAGAASVSVNVTDSDGGRAASGPLPYPVDADPSIASVRATPSAVDVGQEIELNVSGLSGGAAPFDFDWTGLPTGCSASDVSTISCDPSAPGDGTASVTVTDSNGLSVNGTVGYSVYSDPSVAALVGSRASADVGQAVTFDVQGAGGGQAPYRYDWTGLPPGCAVSDMPDIDCVPSGPSAGVVSVYVTDADNFTVSASVPFTAYEDPTVSAPTASPTTGAVGESVTFSAATTSGSGSLEFAWAGLPPGCAAANASYISCSPSAAGRYAVSVTVTDSDGVSAVSAGLTYEVSSAPTGGAPLTGLEGYALFGGLLALAAASLALLAHAVRRGRAPRASRPPPTRAVRAPVRPPARR